MLLSIFLVTTLSIMVLYGATLIYYVLLKPIETSKRSDRDLPFISVLVPARNEEGKIRRCLESLLKQNYPNFELIVIDDRSTDSTGQIIQSIAESDDRVKYVKGKDAPSGWIGKCNALAHAVGHASGEFFIFTDADTYHHSNSLRDSVTHAIDNKIDLMSFVPMQELGSFSERLIMPVLLSSFLIGDPFHAVNNPKNTRAYAYGQYILCRRSSYLAAGGHQSVRDEIVEDHAIARVFKEKGFKIEVADGKSLYSVRMYTDLESLWMGWTKNLYSFIESKWLNLVMMIILTNCIVVLPWIYLGYVISRYVSGDIDQVLFGLTALVAVQIAVLALWQKRTSCHHAGLKWYHFFLTPFGCMTMSALYLHSAYLVHTGGQVNWKGRRYVVNMHKTIENEDGQDSRSAQLLSRDLTE